MRVQFAWALKSDSGLPQQCVGDWFAISKHYAVFLKARHGLHRAASCLSVNLLQRVQRGHQGGFAILDTISYPFTLLSVKHKHIMCLCFTEMMLKESMKLTMHAGQLMHKSGPQSIPTESCNAACMACMHHTKRARCWSIVHAQIGKLPDAYAAIVVCTCTFIH
jgi:hypothetical protein